MFKKLLLLVLVGSMISAGGEDSDSNLRKERNEELKEIVKEAKSPLDAYRLLMQAGRKKRREECVIL